VGISEEDAFVLGVGLNLARRQLSPEQIREIRRRQKKIALELRRQHKSQKEVAKIVGVPRRTIDFWEGDVNNSNVTNTYTPPDLRTSIPKKHCITGFESRLSLTEQDVSAGSDSAANFHSRVGVSACFTLPFLFKNIG